MTCLLFQKKLTLWQLCYENIPFISEATPEYIVSSLESCSVSTFELFSNCQMNVIHENCHLSINVNRPSTIKIGEHIISNSYYEKLLNVKIIAQFSLSNNLEKIIKTSENAYFKQKVINKCFFLNAFQLLSTCTSSFVDLLAKDGSATTHTRNVKAIAMFKVYKNITTELMQALFYISPNSL